MESYNISFLIQTMQAGLAQSQENTGRIILNPIAEQVRLDVTPKLVTNLVKQYKDVNSDFKNALTRKDVLEKARTDIIKDVFPRINPLLIDDICKNILDRMHADKSVPSKMKKRFQAYIDNDKYEDFFVDAILYALSRDNLVGDPESGDNDYYLIGHIYF